MSEPCSTLAKWALGCRAPSTHHRVSKGVTTRQPEYLAFEFMMRRLCRPGIAFLANDTLAVASDMKRQANAYLEFKTSCRP